MLSVSPLGVLSVSPLGVEDRWGGGAHSACFSGFSNVILRGGCPPFFEGVFFRFFCASQECPHAESFAIILWISGQFLWMFVYFLLLVFRFLAPTALCLDTSQTIWRIFPSLGGARPQCDETRQPRHPQCAFWPHPGFAFGTILDALLLIFEVL